MSGNIGTLLSIATPLALMIVLWVMAQISRRFGEVTHRPPHYRGFYVALVLMILPLGVRLLAVGLSDTEMQDQGGTSTAALLHDIPLAASISLALVIAWRYWGWLVYAREGESAALTPPNRK